MAATVKWSAKARAGYRTLDFWAKRACNRVIRQIKNDPINTGRSEGGRGDMRRRQIPFHNGLGLLVWFDNLKGRITIEDIVHQ